jgi:hypothetical protein
VRLARLGDLRRALEKRNLASAPRLKRLKFSNLPGFDDSLIEPNTGFVGICGGTGVGKTAILELVCAALEPHEEGVELEVRSRLGTAQVDITIETSNGEYQSSTSPGEKPQSDRVGYPDFELARLETRTSYLKDFLNEGDLEVLKEGVDPYSLEEATVDIISGICRKPYKEIRIYEIEIDSGEFAPFFQVTLPEISYDSRSMATGELSVLYLAWVLRTSNPNSIILIEEPEAHLPPSSHAAVFALIADAALRGNLCVIITTHSPTIAEHIPHSGLVSIKTTGLRSSIPRKKEARMRVLSRLGLRPKIGACLFVEDAVAAVTLREILAWFEFHIVCTIEVVNLQKGDGAVKNAVESLPATVTSIRFAGVLDGDAKTAAKKWKCKDSLAFLPFDKAIEQELLSALESAPEKSAESLGRPHDALEDALETTLGQDHHDRFKAIANQLTMAPEELVRGALDRWKKKPGRRTKVNRFAIELARLLKVDLP